MRTTISALTLAAVVAFAAGCGGGSDKSSDSGGGGSTVNGNTIEISLKDFSLEPSKVTVTKPGQYTINAKNNGGTAHAIAIEGNGVDQDGETVDPGGTSTVTVDLNQAGEYEIYCPVGNHKSLGMKGALTVQSATPAATGNSSNDTSNGYG